MKNAITIFGIGYILLTIITYLLASFIQASLDFTTWDITYRFIIVMVYIGVIGSGSVFLKAITDVVESEK